MTEKLSTEALRQQNRRNVFECFYKAAEPLTKQQIVAALSLSLPTVTQNLKDLTKAGLIAPAGQVASTGGRRPRTMQLVANARFAVGVSLSSHHIQLMAINLKAEELAYERLCIVFHHDAHYYKKLKQAVESFIDRLSLHRSLLLGIGITLPGIIDQEKNVIELAPVLQLQRTSLSFLSDLFPYPIYVENDASAGGYAEWHNYNALDSIAYLFLGKGLGGALLLNGHPYHGLNHRSGEFGHINIVPNGKQCNCGRKGCLEAYCSIARLTEDLDLSLNDFFAALRVGNHAALHVWDEYLNFLSLGIHSIRMVLDCNVVLGGPLASHLGPHLLDLQTRLQRLNSFHDTTNYLHIGKFQTKGNCIGAALHFVDAFIQDI